MKKKKSLSVTNRLTILTHATQIGRGQNDISNNTVEGYLWMLGGTTQSEGAPSMHLHFFPLN